MSTVTSRSKKEDGLAYDEYGDDGPTVLLIHSLGTSKRLFADTAHLLAGRRVIAIDLPGHGDSDAPSFEYGIPDYADHLMAFMHTLDLRPDVLGGTSIGAGIALEICSRPRHTSSSLLLNGLAGWHLASQGAARRKTVSEAVLGPDGLPRAGISVGGTVRPVDLGEAEKREKDLQRSGRWFCSALWAITTYDPISRLQHVDVPTTILMGEADFHVPTGYALEDGIRGARVSIVPGAGHLTPYDAPEAMNTAVNDLLGDIN